MGSLLRSENMTLCQLFLQSESAYASVSELGELGLVQFRDLNPDVTAYQRKFVTEIRRCEEMERKLRFIEKEIRKDEINVTDRGDNPTAPAPREMIDLETSLDKLEGELREVNSNAEALKKNFLELTELKHTLRKAQQFFEEHETSLTEEAQNALANENQVEFQRVALHLGFVAGVLLRERLPAFELMLWRACRGNVFLKRADIDTSLEDPVTGVEVHKCVFLVFFQGDQLKAKIKKICEGVRATLYPCPESASVRREMAGGVMTRLEDLNMVMKQTTAHRHRLLVLAAENITDWLIRVKKMKAIYHTLNMFNLDVTQKCLIAECWCAVDDVDNVKQALRFGQEKSGSSVSSILNCLSTSQTPPTYHRTNKFTAVYQALIDSYGVASYREVNPAPFSIITFPFLFSVMFGDFGHGFIMFLVGLWMIVKEKRLIASKIQNEIWTMFFGGRYLIMLMGLFSIYAGLLYNDIFSKSIAIFGPSKWRAPSAVYDNFKVDFSTVTLNPDPYWNGTHTTPVYNHSRSDYTGSPYPFGLDPIWALASNKLNFINSFKMKLSVIFGVFHMLFGLSLGLLNQLYFSNYINIFCEFIPQMLFLCCTFLYMVIEIFAKWFMWSARHASRETTTGCAPSILIGTINMYLFTYKSFTDFEEEFYCEPTNPVFGEAGKSLQYFLVFVVVICIPWILIPKPYLIWRRSKKHQYQPVYTEFDDQEEIIQHDQLQSSDTDDKEDTEDSISDVIVHQSIHTIEYCLGCVSHTASYLRLWALSLAHAQLSEVLWMMVMRFGLSSTNSYLGAFLTIAVFPVWAVMTVVVLLLMEGLSAFLHTLRLHWVEFNSKFYSAQGYAFEPFSFSKLEETISSG